mgnify:CR=1 FL=1
MLNEVLENIKSRRRKFESYIGSGSVCSQRYEFPDMAFHSHSGC